MIRHFLKSVYHIIGGSSQHPVIECDNKLTTPENAVESIDDLLIEILLRLPVISILLFKSVSKRWYSIITNPNFTPRYRSTIPKLDPASGLYIERHGSYSVYDFVPLDTRVQFIKSSPSNIIFRYYHRKVIILQSCHGLLLCRGAYKHHNDYNYYVYNPTTNMFKNLPRCPVIDGTMKMAYDPTKSPHYKLVYAKPGDYNHVLGLKIRIYIYSSEIGNWSDCGDRYWSNLSDFGLFKYGIYWSNAIHWVDGSNHNKLCLQDLAITSIQAPGKQCCNFKLFESCGCLLIVRLCPHFSLHNGELNQLNVYEMSNGHFEWSTKYIVHLNEAMRSFPEIWVYPYKLVSTIVWCVVLSEREEDSFMVIDLDGAVMHYKLMSNTLHKLPYLESFNHQPRSFQFIASFAHV